MMKKIKLVGATLSLVLLAGAAFVGTSHAAESGQTAIQLDDSTTQLADEDAYSVSASSAQVKTGAGGTVNVVIKAKGDHKINEQYPHKVKWEDPPAGVDLPKRKLKKGDGSFVDKKTFSFAVPVKGKSAGKHTIKGMVKFSVCNDSQCVIKKVPLTATVTVS